MLYIFLFFFVDLYQFANFFTEKDTFLIAEKRCSKEVKDQKKLRRLQLLHNCRKYIAQPCIVSILRQICHSYH